MKVKSRTLFVKNGKEVKKRSLSTNRRFLSRIRASKGDKYRVLITYDSNEYQGKPTNDSGWYANKKKLLKTAREFLRG